MLIGCQLFNMSHLQILVQQWSVSLHDSPDMGDAEKPCKQQAQSTVRSYHTWPTHPQGMPSRLMIALRSNVDLMGPAEKSSGFSSGDDGVHKWCQMFFQSCLRVLKYCKSRPVESSRTKSPDICMSRHSSTIESTSAPPKKRIFVLPIPVEKNGYTVGNFNKSALSR